MLQKKQQQNKKNGVSNILYIADEDFLLTQEKWDDS